MAARVMLFCGEVGHFCRDCPRKQHYPPHKFQLAQARGDGQVAAPVTDQLVNVEVDLMSPGAGLAA